METIIKLLSRVLGAFTLLGSLAYIVLTYSGALQSEINLLKSVGLAIVYMFLPICFSVLGIWKPTKTSLIYVMIGLLIMVTAFFLLTGSMATG